VQIAAQLLEGLIEKRANEIRLQLARLGLFHFFLDCEQAALIHHLFTQGIALDDGFQVLGIQRTFYLAQ
jgi:hypothetical protein